ncbi:MAG: Kelch repeat-containing protein, partial [Candidatus Limnocylindrales bacterium]
MTRPTRRPRRRAIGLLLATVIVVPGACGPTLPVTPAPSASPTPALASPSPTATASTSGQPVETATWTPVQPAGGPPAARDGHSWTTDPSSAVAYLFGGRGAAGELDDLWVYDMTADAWQQLSPTGARPTARYDHAAAWIDGLGLVVAGGRSASGVLADLWAYDPSANDWRTLDTTGPVPAGRSGACSALRTDGSWWMYGGAGADGAGLAELWQYDSGRSAWVETTVDAGPLGRLDAACWWTNDGRFDVYGGRPRTDGPPVTDGAIWSLDPALISAAQAWSSVAGPAGPDRARAAITSNGDAAVVVGGLGADGAPRSDLVVVGPDGATLLGPG